MKIEIIPVAAIVLALLSRVFRRRASVGPEEPETFLHRPPETTSAGDNQLVVELAEQAGRELHLRPGLPICIAVKSHSTRITSLKRREHHEE